MYAQMTIIGNLTKQPEIRYIPSGTAVAKCSIAYTDGFGDKKTSHFIDIELWGKTAEAFNQYCRKGSKIMIVGFPKFEQWTAQDGSNRNRHSLRVETMKMLDSKSDAQGQNGYAGTPPPHNPQVEKQGANPQYNNHNHQAPVVNEHTIPEIDIDEDEIPFNNG